MPKLAYLPPLALVICLLALPATASADQTVTDVSFQGNATLVTNSEGINFGVNVTLHYVCPAASGLDLEGTISVDVFEDLGGGASAVGSGGAANLTCDGSTQSVTVTVFGGPFQPGVAVGRALIMGLGNQVFAGTVQQFQIK